MAPRPDLAALLPQLDDLPGAGWSAYEKGLGDADAVGSGDLFDCLGDDFPGEAETLGSASSPHFVRPPRQLVHGTSVAFTTTDAGSRAASVLRRPAFARCLGESVAADLFAEPGHAELLTVEVVAAPGGHRATFTGADASGVLAVHLDIVVVPAGAGVSLLWFADTPRPFPAVDRAYVVHRIAARARAAGR